MAEKKKKKISTSRLSGLVENIKVEHDVPVLERIRFPIIWERLPSGYRIQDLQPSKIDNAIDIIKDYYIREEILCKGISLCDDPDAVDEYLSLVAHWLKDTQSLAAVEEGTGSIIGLLIGRVLDRTVMIQSRMTIINTATNLLGQLMDDLILPFENKTLIPIKECPPAACEQVVTQLPSGGSKKKNKPQKGKEKKVKTIDSKVTEPKGRKSKSSIKSARISKLNSIAPETREFGVLGKKLEPMFDDEATIVYNPKLFAIQKFKSYLTGKVDILSLYDVDLYYSIYLMLVIPQHRDKGIAKSLIRCALEMTKKFNCDVVAGIFTSKISQNIAYKEGFQILEEMKLSEWQIEGEEVFTGVDDGEENTAVVMGHRIVVPEPPPPPPVLHAPRRSKSDRTNKAHAGR